MKFMMMMHSAVVEWSPSARGGFLTLLAECMWMNSTYWADLADRNGWQANDRQQLCMAGQITGLSQKLLSKLDETEEAEASLLKPWARKMSLHWLASSR